jgi:hypothetical protein
LSFRRGTGIIWIERNHATPYRDKTACLGLSRIEQVTWVGKIRNDKDDASTTVSPGIEGLQSLILVGAGYHEPGTGQGDNLTPVGPATRGASPLPSII